MNPLGDHLSTSSSCFCFGVGREESTDHFVQQQKNQDNLTREDRKKKEEIDTMLTEALNDLTVEERQEQQDFLHGVHDEIAEESSFIDTVLQDLHSHLSRLKPGSIYETAERMDPEYINSRAFRLTFLRANRCDAKATASRMLIFFEIKKKLFGLEKLVKDITIEDLDEDDLKCLRTGCIQLIGKDSACRQIVLELPALRAFKNLQNELRARYFALMSLLKNSEETQIRGVVGITYTIGEFRDKSNEGGFMENLEVTKAIPLYYAAVHFCCDDIPKYTVSSLVVNAMPKKLRARFRIHCGSHLECQYLLSTYGIPKALLPFTTSDCKLCFDYHNHWHKSFLVPERDNTVALVSNATDVLYMGGKKSSNAGNHRLLMLVKERSQIYDAGSKDKRRNLVDEIIGEIHMTGGRFLIQTKEPNRHWKELPLDKVRSKVTQQFRNYRHRKIAARQKADDGTIISGQPFPADVVFGKAQRSRGSELLHYLIKDRLEEYEALGRGMKSKVVDAIVDRIKSEGGRFLQPKQDDGGEWVYAEVSCEMARARVSKYFCNYRRPLKKMG